MKSQIADELIYYSLSILIIILQTLLGEAMRSHVKLQEPKELPEIRAAAKAPVEVAHPEQYNTWTGCQWPPSNTFFPRKTTEQNQTRNWSGTRLQYTGKYVEVERKGTVKKEERGRSKPTKEEQSVTMCNFCYCKRTFACDVMMISDAKKANEPRSSTAYLAGCRKGRKHCTCTRCCA